MKRAELGTLGVKREKKRGRGRQHGVPRRRRSRKQIAKGGGAIAY